jgi:hypothetical protein
MMNALIDPRFDRICETALTVFPVANPLFWVPCQDDCISDFDYFNPATQKIIYLPRPEPEATVDLVGTTVEEF